MHTGCENFWMYQNNRHEPVLSLPKNDNYSHAVLTDTYKQVLNGGSPNNFNSCILPQSNVARSHQSNQHRITGCQYVWPSSVYSLPLRSSPALNFHSQESYSNQSNNLNYQVHQNYDSRYLRNPNLNLVFVNNSTNSDNYSNAAKAQSSENTKTSVARIRVKDVFTLNNNSLFDNAFQTSQKGQSECALNFATTNHLTSGDSKLPSEYMDFEKINLLESNNSSLRSGPKVAKQSNGCELQKYLQHSISLYQPIGQLSTESQFQPNGNKESSLSSNTFKTNVSVTGQPTNHEKIQEEVRNSNDFQPGSRRIKVKPKRNSSDPSNSNNSEGKGSHVSLESFNSTRCSDLLQGNDVTRNDSISNKVASTQTQFQENLFEIDQANAFGDNCVIGKGRKWGTSGQCFASNKDSFPENQFNELEGSMIKIEIPHIGHSSFLRLTDTSKVERNFNLISSCGLEPKSQLEQALCRKISIHKQINTQENGVTPQINQGSAINSNAVSSANNIRINSPVKAQSDLSCLTVLISTSKTSESVNQKLNQKEPVDSAQVGTTTVLPVGSTQENSSTFLKSENFSENIVENFNSQTFSPEETEAISCNDTTLNSLVIKQETLGIENSQEQCNPIKEVLDQVIKIEENSEESSLHEQKPELPSSENINALEKNQLPNTNNTENGDVSIKDTEKLQISSKEPESMSETISNALSSAENCNQELNDSKSIKDEKNNNCLTENKIDSRNLGRKKLSTSEQNYKSKINRDKLDLLIEFLSKEEDMTETTSADTALDHPPSLTKNDVNNKMKKEVKPNRNRRKLSKTCIVKNKNNSREMISLLSHKIAQVEIFKCSPQTLQTAETNKNLDKNEAKKNSPVITDKIEERKTNSAENSSMADKGFDLSEKHTETNNPLQIPQTEKDLLKFEPKDINMSGNEKCQGTSKKSSSGKECDTQEEENVINTMRAFQNLKTHFCMSCDLISGIDSFWINVVSGELRCLNCFKKMLSKGEDSNILKLKAENTEGNNDIDTDLVQQGKAKQALENGEENKEKTGCENDFNNKNTLDFTECRSAHKKIQEDIKQEPMEYINETAKDKIISNSNSIGEESFISDLRRAEIMNCSISLGKRNESRENNALLLETILEAQNELNVEESKNKLKEDVCRKTKIGEISTKPEMKELQQKATKENFAIIDKIQSSEMRVSSNASKKNYPATKAVLLNYSNALEGKNTSKKESVSPKFSFSENYKNERLTEGSTKKIISKESHVVIENSKQLSKDCKKQESADKLEKSIRKCTSKHEDCMEEVTKKEKKEIKNSQNQIRKRNNSREEFVCPKVQILEEHSKKELQLTDSLSKSNLKTCSIETCACHKTHTLENMKINLKNEPSDKLKVQSPLKEFCIDFKTKISEHLKPTSKETFSSHEFKRKNAGSYNSIEKNKKEEAEHSRKRKNSEDYSPHKIRVVEEQTKKEIKPVTHVSERTKIVAKDFSGYHESKRSECEKPNRRDSGEKLKKSNSSKTDYASFGKFMKKEEKQVLDSSDKWKPKGELPLEKTKNSEQSKHEGIDSSELPRSRSSKEGISLNLKEHSKIEIKKVVVSGGRHKSSLSKEDFYPSRGPATRNTKKEIKIGSLPPKIKGCEKTEEKERRLFHGKIPKRSQPVALDTNTNEVIKSPLNKMKEMSDAAVKAKQGTRIRNATPNSKYITEWIKSEKINKKPEVRSERETGKREREVIQKQRSAKFKKELENDMNQRKILGQAKDSNNQDRKGKAVDRYERIKENMFLNECQQKGAKSEKVESATLLSKLIKKTKKLSWSLLKEP